MEGINWANYTSADFTLFCNALLSMEIGKQFEPYSAPGKDYGIDGYFTGKYREYNGNWRFQYKFHQGARKQGFDLLKSDLKIEINKIKNEDVFVLLTNVELLPQESILLNEVFKQNLSPRQPQTRFELWDGAKLFTLFLQYPILSLWLNEGFETAQLQDYRVAFQSNLENASEEPSTLNNYFVARENDISQLESFLISSDIMILVTGEAGIGKTRTVIEFFNKVSKMEEWLTLVLLNRSIDFDKIRKALSGNKKFIILIDDAHTFSPETIADIKKLAELRKASIKLVLTSRNLEAYTSLKLIKEYEQEKISKIQLSELSRVETKKLFQHELQKHHFINYLDELTLISHGKPILIVALLRAIKNGTNISKVREENFLSHYVRNYFDGFISVINEETGIAKLQISKLLQLICLIEPFNYADNATAAKLASACSIQVDVVLFALKKMRSSGISSGRYEQSIRPDYYSDILLMDADPDMLANLFQDFMEFINNIITNLSSVDEVKKQEGSILDLLLSVYINSIKYSENINDISKIFTTAASIAYLKPKIAADTINIYSANLETPDSLISEDLRKHQNYYFQSPESIHGRAKSILFDLLYHKNYYEFVYHAIHKLYKLTKDDKIISSVLHFARRDFIDHYKLKRQTYFVEYCSSRINKMQEEECFMVIQFCKNFLQLDFSSTSVDIANQNSLIVSTYYLPNSLSVKNLRQKVITLLIKIYHNIHNVNVRSCALFELADIPRGIFANQRNPTPYKGNTEIGAILDFLMTIVSDIPTISQKEVIDKIFWYKKWGISKTFYEKLDKISQLMVPKNLTEKLVHLFSKSELLLSSQAEQKVIERSRELINSANADNLSISILELCEEKPNEFPYLWTFLSVLQREYPDLTMDVYTTLWNNNKSFIYQFGAPFLQELYFTHGQVDFFWNCVQQLKTDNNSNADNVLLRVYSHYPFKDHSIHETDVELISEIAAKKNQANNFELARALHTMLKFNKVAGKSISIEFLERCSQREADIFFVFLVDQDSQDFEVLKLLTLKYSFRFSVTYEIERCLNKIVRKEGIGLVINYFIKRFFIQKEFVKEKKTFLYYDWVPNGHHSHLFDGVDDQEKYKFFYAIVNWYLHEPSEPIDLFFAKDFLEYGRPANHVVESLADFFETLVDSNLNNPIKIERILECLEVFHEKEPKLINLVVSTYSMAHEMFSTNEEVFKGIQYKCYAALTTMGVKSGSAGQPFQVDLDLKNLLSSKLKEIQDYSPVHKFLSEVIKSIDKDIQSQYERNNEQW